jgi:tripartite motif-containing protein 71
VVDRLNHRIQAFTLAGEFLTSWGILGSTAGQFAFPTDVAVSSSGQILVVDARNDRVQVFDFGVSVKPTSWSFIKAGSWR